MFNLKKKGSFIMLELREYKAAELAQILKTNTKQALDRKLESWGIAFTSDERRGDNRKYTLTAIENPFRNSNFTTITIIKLIYNII